MAKSAAAEAPAPKLQPFEGREVIAASIKITKAGDGLSASLNVEPRELHHGERVFVVLECEVSDVSFPPVPKTDKLSRKATLATEVATLVDAELVEHVLAEQRRKIEDDQARRKALADAEKGVTQLPGTEHPAVAGGSEPWPEDAGLPGGPGEPDSE